MIGVIDGDSNPKADPRASKPVGRLAGLDAFRGFTIAAMILVNNPGSWGEVYPALRHADWHGCTPTDLVFPFFLFIVGVSCSFSLGKYTASGRPTAGLWLRTGRRVAVLFGLGLLLNGFPDYEVDDLRVMGVLQRIAVVYALLVPVVVLLGVRWQVIAGAGLLAGYGLFLGFVPPPGSGSASIAPGTNWVLWLDELVLGRAHMYAGAQTDPEGLLGTAPALVTAMLGYWSGLLVCRAPATGQARWDLSRVALVGSVLAPAGLLLSQLQPMNKPLWTPSYVLFTGGLACWGLAVCVWFCDVRGWRRAAAPAIVFGVNAIFVFVASGVAARLLTMGDPAIKTRVYQNLFSSWLDGADASLAYACVYVALWWVVLAAMKRAGIVLRV